MVVLSLAYQSLKNRKLATILTLCSIALSVALLIGVEQVQTAAREGFRNTISQTDLIVGGRGGSLSLLLYTVFRLGSASNDISWASYQKIRNDPAVEWTIPYSLGDSHRGFRVVGTTDDFYRHYRYHHDRQVTFAEGRPPADVFDVALGNAVEAKLHYRLGQKIVLTHGISSESSAGILDHSDKPFTVVGILNQTATPVDRSLYITLEGEEAMHVDWIDGAPPIPGQEVPASAIRKQNIHIKSVTSFLLRAHSRIDSLTLQRKINTFPDEPLQAIIPGVALSELWTTFDYADESLSLIAIFVLIVSLLGMLASLYTTLNERRRELAILRVLGVGPAKIAGLLILESGLLSVAGALLGVAAVYSLSFGTQSLVTQRFGLFLPIMPLTFKSYLCLAAITLAGFAVGLVPALRAYRNTLADHLSLRL